VDQRHRLGHARKVSGPVEMAEKVAQAGEGGQVADRHYSSRFALITARARAGIDFGQRLLAAERLFH
jgi:hypothetical protein